MVGQTPETQGQVRSVLTDITLQHLTVSHPQGLPFGSGVVRPNPVAGQLPSGALTEQEILEQMSTQRQQPPPPPQPAKPNPHQLPPNVLSFLAGHPINMELVSRPEGKQLLMGLESGNITIDHLVQQLNNPALQVRFL